MRERWQRLEERALERHVKRGRPRAIFQMGLRGIGAPTPAARDLSRRALERALEMKVREAGWWLGRQLQDEKDWDGARRAYEEGKRLGDSFAAYSLGMLLRNHFKDAPGAIAVLEDAAFKMGDRSATHSLGLLEREAGRHVRARRAFRRGVELFDPLSMEWLADEYREAVETRGPRRKVQAAVLRAGAVRCYQRAVEHGSHLAASKLGALLLELKDIGGPSLRLRRAYGFAITAARMRWVSCCSAKDAPTRPSARSTRR